MTRPDLLVIGCSAGGLQALQRLLRGFRPKRLIPVLVVCHTASEDLSGLCTLLQRCSPWPIREAQERLSPEPGVVHLAPSGYHLLVERDGTLSLSVDERVSYARPSIDVLFESAALAFGAAVTGVILTGANHDGAAGLAQIRAAGGGAVIQDPHDAEVATMPEAALARAGADHVVPVATLGPLLQQLIDQKDV